MLKWPFLSLEYTIYHLVKSTMCLRASEKKRNHCSFNAYCTDGRQLQNVVEVEFAGSIYQMY